MRQSDVRQLKTILVLFALVFPALLVSQIQSRQSAPGSVKPTQEVEVRADQGPALIVSKEGTRDRLARGPQATSGTGDAQTVNFGGFRATARPRQGHLRRARPFRGDLRTLPQVPPQRFERPEREAPLARPIMLPGTETAGPSQSPGQSAPLETPVPSAPAPAPTISFDGLDFANWGAGHPPDTNGDAGPTYYIQTINTSIGIYRKADGTQVAAFTFNTLMSQGNFGNLCDTNNFGDPVVLYDTFEDRWIISDFAFQLDGSNNIVNPPGDFQCFAVSKTGDPVAGGWNFYSINVAGGLGDYPKLAIWTDGLYMSANVFGYTSGAAFQNARVWGLNKSQMYAGAAYVQVVSFDAPAADFTILPSNARLQTGTPPPGTPNYFLSTWEFTNAVTVYKFHVDWTSPLLSTFTGPDTPVAATSWPNSSPPNAPSQGGNSLDVLPLRAMVQNQYSNLGGVESLWATHTVRRGNTSGFAAPRYYQVDVTGGTVAASIPQAATWDPDGANVMYRFNPSVAVDRAGDMALGYSTSSSTTFPAIQYAGRLAGDPVNTLTQSEQVLIQGTGTQTGTCGGTCTRWGDYSAMTLDPDGCSFWYTNMYYAVDGLSFLTRIGNFSFPGCTPVGSGGTLQGSVIATAVDAPIAGASVVLGSRTATTDGNGYYSFAALPAGTYPGITASAAGYVTGNASSTVVTDGDATTQNFFLASASTSGCLVDTSQADFQGGAVSNCDLTGSPGDVTLLNASPIDQQNTTLSNSGVGITITTWGGQTFTAAVSGELTRADINLFCSGCTGTTPDLTLSLRDTSAGLPTGSDLASATITGFSSGSSGYFTANFSTPPTLTAGTQYALVIRPTANPSPGTYALTRSSTNVYAGGTRVSGASSGNVWSIPLTAGQSTDAGFKTYVNSGFASSGTFVSSVKDANPDPLSSANWGTISWTADTPSGTNIQFQAAASSNLSGFFAFVGPDGTASTFFTNGGSLAQFNGNRYLEYQASFATNSGAATPTLHDVTICFNDVVNALGSSLAVAAANGPYGGTATLSATLTASSAGLSGKTVNFSLNENKAGSAVTDNSGVATLTDVMLTGINAGNYPGAVGAAFAGDSGYSASNGTATLTVSLADQAITFAALAGKNFGDADFTVSATASSGLTVSFVAKGSCSISGTTVHLTGAGSCTVTALQAGDSNYNVAPDVPRTFSIAGVDQTITFGALASKTFGDGDFTVGATASSELTLSFAAAGNCSVAGTTVHITGAGSCTVTASQSGDSNYNAAPDVPQTFSIAKASQTITFAALSTKTMGAPDFTVSATSSAGLAVSFSASGNCSVSGATVHLTGAGSCTITAVQAGNSNYNAATSVPRTFTINPGDDFTIAPTLPAVNVTAGQSVTEHITLTPVPATTSALTFSCSGLPAKTTCTFVPNPVPPGSAPVDVVLTIATTAAQRAALDRPQAIYASWLGFTSMGLIGVVVIGIRRKGRRKTMLLGALGLLVALTVAGCGGRSTQTVAGTPLGTSTVTVTGANSSFTHATTFTLTVH